MNEILSFDFESAENYASVLASAADAIVSGEIALAEERLLPVAGHVWAGRITAPTRTPTEPSTEGRRRRRNLPEQLRAQVFMRDGFRCSGCGGRTIPRNVLVAFSDAYPIAIPYNRHYVAASTHPAYWALAPEADHVVPHSRGGEDSLENLTTLHAACNTRKSATLSEHLPSLYRNPPPGSDEWDGLMGSYRSIVALGDTQGIRHAAASYHTRWLRAYNA